MKLNKEDSNFKNINDKDNLIYEDYGVDVLDERVESLERHLSILYTYLDNGSWQEMSSDDYWRLIDSITLLKESINLIIGEKKIIENYCKRMSFSEEKEKKLIKMEE